MIKKTNSLNNIIVSGSLTSIIFIREILNNEKKNNIFKYNSDECQTLCSGIFFVLFYFVLLGYLNEKNCNFGALLYFCSYVC